MSEYHINPRNKKIQIRAKNPKILRLKGIARLLSRSVGPLGEFARLRVLRRGMSRHMFACGSICTMKKRIVNK